jgi:hypothetical protein
MDGAGREPDRRVAEVDNELATVLRTVFATQPRIDSAGTHAVIRSGDGFFATRVRLDPVAELFVTTRALDGFELRLRCEDYQGGAFHEAVVVDTNDHVLAPLWLDATTKAAVLASAYEYEVPDVSFAETVGLRLPRLARRTWTYELANDELVGTKGTIEYQPQRIAAALGAATTIAARSHRWAAEYAVLARELGGSARTEVELGGAPILSVTRHAIDVTLRLLRRSPDTRDQLRTLLTASRVAHEACRLSLIDGELPRSARPPLPDGSKRSLELGDYKLRADGDPAALLDEQAKKLVLLARPAAVIADVDSVDVWFLGAPIERERIDAAIELVARWAVGGIATHGPYR